MDATPTAVAQAGVTLYQAGGFALLLLAIGVVGGSWMAWVMVKMINRLNTRLDEVQDNYLKTTQVCITENTASNKAVISTVGILAQVMRERLPSTGHTPHYPHTPLPGT